MSKLEEMEKRLNQSSQGSKKDKTLLYFLLGVILLCVGIYLVCRNTYIEAGWYLWRMGSMSISSGLSVIPVLVGIGMLFYNSKSFIAKLVLIVGIVILLISIIMSVHIRFRTVDLYTYILMFGSIFAGAGLLLRALFKGGK